MDSNQSSSIRNSLWYSLWKRHISRLNATDDVNKYPLIQLGFNFKSQFGYLIDQYMVWHQGEHVLHDDEARV
jgi:hypothetical protein